MKKLDSVAWVSALALLALAAVACSTGEQQQAGHAQHMEMETATDHAEHMETEAVATDTPVQVTDPVCGMSVTTSSEHMAMHEGETYYFCSERCMNSFTENPEAYVKKDAPGRPGKG